MYNLPRTDMISISGVFRALAMFWAFWSGFGWFRMVLSQFWVVRSSPNIILASKMANFDLRNMVKIDQFYAIFDLFIRQIRNKTVSNESKVIEKLHEIMQTNSLTVPGLFNRKDPKKLLNIAEMGYS